MPVLLSRYQFRKNLAPLELDAYRYLLCDHNSDNLAETAQLRQLTDDEVLITINSTIWGGVTETSGRAYEAAKAAMDTLVNAYTDRTSAEFDK